MTIMMLCQAVITPLTIKVQGSVVKLFLKQQQRDKNVPKNYKAI